MLRTSPSMMCIPQCDSWEEEAVTTRGCSHGSETEIYTEFLGNHQDIVRVAAPEVLVQQV